MMKDGFKLNRKAWMGVSWAFTLLIGLGMFFPEIDVLGITAFLLGGGASGLMFAQVAVAGTVTTDKKDTAAPGHVKRSISRIVTELKPDEYPLDTMIRNSKNEAIPEKNIKVEWEEVKYRERNDVVDSGGFTAAGDAGDEQAVIPVTKIGIWGKDDTVYIPSILNGGGKALRLHVSSVNRSGGTITCFALNGDTGLRVPTIAETTPIYRMGTAKTELASTTDIITQLPAQNYNYCQVQMAYIEQSVMASLESSYSGYDHKEKVLQEIYNMRSSCEATHLFGFRGKYADPGDSELKYHAGGIEESVTKVHEFGDTGSDGFTIDKEDINSLLKTTFANNSANTQRVLLAGSDLIEAMENIKFEKNQPALEHDIYLGVNVMKLKSNFGELNIKYHKLLDGMGWEKKGFVLDMDYIFKHDYEAMQTKKLDPDSAGLRRVKDAMRIHDTSCITVRYAESAHLVWQQKTT
jgi:hypothetical protein